MTLSEPGEHALDTKAVRRVAELARLHVEDEEVEELVRHFGGILEHFNTLSKARKEGILNLDAVDPFLFEDTEIPPTREDVPFLSEVREDVLALAPRRNDSFFVVPRILTSIDRIGTGDSHSGDLSDAARLYPKSSGREASS